MPTTRGRQVFSNQVVFDQADFFQSDGFTRVTGLTTSNLTCELFFNNILMPWSFLSGVGISDAQIAAGKVYWMEIPTDPGRYNIRWRPNAVGYWRLLITYTAGQQIMGQDYDFIKPGCS
jgi:hypothetical protein